MAFESTAGRLLVASPVLSDGVFDRTVVLVLEHDEYDGAIGLVLNRPSDTDVAEVLPDIRGLVGDPPVVFVGGPVQPQAAVCLGAVRNGAAPDGFAPLRDGLATVDLEHDPGVLATGLREVRVFAGYAGWGGGQLEGELAVQAWLVVDALPGDPFTSDPDRLWRAVLRRQGGDLAMLATFPDDPGLN